MNEFIEWKSLDFKKQSGQEKIRCPKCDEKSSDKRDKSLLVNHNDGFGKCFYLFSFSNCIKYGFSKRAYNNIKRPSKIQIEKFDY